MPLKEHLSEAKSNYDIEIFNLTKKYPLKGKNKSITALKGININIEKGAELVQ